MDTSSLVLKYLADASVRSLCLALAALLALRLLRARSAPVRHAVWTAVVCAMLLLPLLSVTLPAIPLRVLQPAAAVAVPAAAAVEGSSQAQTRPVAAPAPGWALPGWTSLALAAYVLIAAALLGRLLVGFVLSRRLVGRSTRIRDARIGELLDRLGITAAVGLAESESITVPLTIGWIKPHILLPSGWQAWDRAKLEAVLTHELAHVRRSDWLVALLAVVNRSVFWFHPLAWWMERKLAGLAEEACDESSLLITGNRERYAQVLLEMADAVRSGSGRLTWHEVAMARPAQVRRRIETILDESRLLSRGMTKARWASVLLCAAPLVYGAAAVQLQPAQAPARTQSAYLDSVADGRQLTPAQAQSIEGYLQANPDDLAARGKLIAYYYRNGIREPRLKHIFWLIEHHPESEIAGFSSTGIAPSGGILNDEADYRRARDLWLEQTRRNPSNTRVLANAGSFFSQNAADAAEAEGLFKQLRQLEPQNQHWTQRLASLYVAVILGSGRPYDPSLAERIKAELESSADGPLLAVTGSQFASMRSQPPEWAVPVVEFGKRLLQRAEELGAIKPPPPRVTGVPGGVVGGVVGGVPGGVPGGVGGGVASKESPEVIHRVPPVYPPLAKQARIQGTIRLKVKIGTDGGVLDTQVIGGHPLLAPAAIDAVKQWVFQPVIKDGQAVEVLTDISINFRLAEEPTTVVSTPPPAQTPQRIRVGGNVQAANLVEKVRPVYPPLAKEARIQGMVRFTATIGTDGHVKDLQLESGHPLLVDAAQDAVSQWVYRPTLLNGQPVEVVTQIDVNFTLAE